MRVAVAGALLVAASLLAPPASAQQSAGQTVVVPSLPGLPNQEIKIAGEDLVGAELVGPELSFTGQVVQWEEGRSITMKFGDGITRVVPVASNVIFPPDLRPGGNLTVAVRQTADGRYRVTGFSPAGPPMAAPPAPARAPAQETAPAPAPEPIPQLPTPGPTGPKGKTVVGASYITLRGTLKSVEPGVSVTLVEASGNERTVKLGEKVSVEGLAPGDAIVVRVPLQKPFDGKTADKVERPKATKTPPPSKFSGAQSPKS